MGWSDYGFPDPTMRTNYSPACAIRLAHKERYEALLYGRTYEDDVVYGWAFIEPEKFKKVRYPHAELVPSDEFTLILDRTFPHGYLSDMKFVNPLLDMSINPTTVLWTENTLRDAVVDKANAGSEYIEYQTSVAPVGTMLPTWDARWAKQFYMQLNLLKIAQTPYMYVVRGQGSGIGNTPEEAYNNALSDFHAVSDHYIWWYTEIKSSGSSWSCSISRPITIEPAYLPNTRLPEALRSLPGYLYGNRTTSTAFDAHGTGFSFMTTPTAGYSRISLPYHPSSPSMPDAFSGGIFGPFYAELSLSNYFASIDYSSSFEFYDNVD